MRTRPAILALLVPAAAPAVLAACSGGGDGGGVAGPDGSEAACPLMERLRSAGDQVESADVADPVAFEQALDDAVADYLSTLDALAEVVPEDLEADVETVRSSVEQYRFDDAVEARASLDEWVGDSCTTSSTT